MRYRSAESPNHMTDPQWAIPREKFMPAYLRTYERDKRILDEKVERAIEALKRCEVCPRDCRIDRRRMN